VSGHKGLLVTVQPPARTAPDGSTRPSRPHSMLLWSAADKVFALQGPGTHDGIELLEMAQSIQ
jgi:hypothetical protein